MRTRSVTALAAVAALAAACGSTVQATSQNSVGIAPTGVGATTGAAPGTSGGDAGLSVPSVAAGGAAVTGPSGVGSSSTGGGSTAPAGSAGAGTSGRPGTPAGTGTTSTPGGKTAAQAPGITASTIYFGTFYSSQEGAADRAIGAAGAAPSYDSRDVTNAVIDYANNHGGFAGRKMKALYYDENLANPRPSEDAAACASFTQDNKIFAMYGQTDELRACAEKAGGISIGPGNDTALTFRKYPHFVDPIVIRLDRLGPVTVGGLYHAHYFSGKLGLITWDDPNYHYTMDHGYLPALSSHHIAPAAPVQYVAVPQQVGAIADMSAQVSNAVTKFRSLGIDHVIIQDGQAGVFAGGGLTLEFMNNAKSQHYYPVYGQNSDNIPGSTELPADEQNKAIAIMDSDYSPKFDSGWHSNAARDKCFKIEADAGYPVSASNDNDEDTAAASCDEIFFLQQVINSLPVLSADAFMKQVTALGTSFKSAFVYGTRLFAGRLDGSDQVRQAEYFSSCQCLKYSGPPYQPD